MPALSKILVPIDIDLEGGPLLAYASMLATAFGASVDLAHVFETSGYEGPRLIELGADGVAQPADAVAYWKTAGVMSRKLANLRAEGVKEVRAHMLHGEIADTILSLARGYDLVVMGSHGRHGLSRLVFGGSSSQVIRECPCPVLTVHLAEGR